MFARLFLDHPRSVDESYVEHFGAASGFGLRLLLVGLACLVHAVLPFLFVRTASATIGDLHRRMVLQRRGSPQPYPGR
jgi:hypothetical protein